MEKNLRFILPPPLTNAADVVRRIEAKTAVAAARERAGCIFAKMFTTAIFCRTLIDV